MTTMGDDDGADSNVTVIEFARTDAFCFVTLDKQLTRARYDSRTVVVVVISTLSQSSWQFSYPTCFHIRIRMQTYRHYILYMHCYT